jgi:hypothetical protein
VKVRIIKHRPHDQYDPWPSDWRWEWTSAGGDEYGSGHFLRGMTWHQAHCNAEHTLRHLGFIR